MSENVPETKYLDPEILQRLGDLELIAREVVEGLRVGSHRSPLRGFSTEFAHHRQYVPEIPYGLSTGGCTADPTATTPSFTRQKLILIATY